jgi:hypothetical protein
VLSQGAIQAQSEAAALAWSVHPLRLLEMVVGPFLSADPGSAAGLHISNAIFKEGMYSAWVESLYFGAIGLGLVVVACRRALRSRTGVIFGLTLGLLLLMCLGKYGGLYHLVYSAVPLWRPFRYPEKLVPYLFFGLALAAAYGLAQLDTHSRSRTHAALGFAAGGGVLLLLAALEGLFGVFSRQLLHWLDAGLTDELSQLAHDQLLHRAVFSAALLLLSGFLLVASRRRAQRWALLIAVVFVARLHVNEPFYVLGLPGLVSEPSSFVKDVIDRSGPIRLGKLRVASASSVYVLPPLAGMTYTDLFSASIAASLVPDTTALWNLESSNSYLPGVSGRVFELQQAGDGAHGFSRFDELVGTRFLSLSIPTFENLGAGPNVVVAENELLGQVLLETPTFKPRAYLGRPLCMPDGPASFRHLTSDDYRPSQVVIGCSRQADFPEAPDYGTARILRYAPERIEIAADVKSPAALVLNDAYYSGWTATVDGAPQRILPANYAVRGLLLAPGRHEIVMRYRTPGLIAAVSVSLAAFLLTLIFGLLSLVRSRRAGTRALPTP